MTDDTNERMGVPMLICQKDQGAFQKKKKKEKKGWGVAALTH